MISTMTLLTLGFIFTTAAMAAMCVVATRSSLLEPAVASPYGGLRADPSNDTLCGAVNMTVYPPALPGEWQTLQLSSLHEVEQTLDSLENHGVLNREVVTMGNDCFAVRWKA